MSTKKEKKTQESKPKKQEVEVKEEKDEDSISILTHPFTTLYYFVLVLVSYVKIGLKFILKHIIVISVVLAVIITPNFIQGPHLDYYRHAEKVGYFMAYWIILGVASSIGLGTGLHTFVLYLGPRIANITIRAYQCNALPEFVPSKWDQTYHFNHCPENVERPVQFLDILLSVQFEAFLWGLGTALGELPPYFIAKAAAASKKKIEELEDVEAHKNDKDLMSVAKRLIYNNLQKYAWITVLLCASIPNPLFDLAGISCGHFGVPFLTFFSAVAIGKSIIKVHIQMIFVIFIFSQGHVEHALQFIENLLPFLKGKLSDMLEKQKNILANGAVSEGEKPLIGQLWDYFIMLMIGYFLVSIINSLAQGYYEDLKNEKKQKEENKKKKDN
ncbi:hypothetical protein ABPG74_013411 [Tetrahymena malaccensis]